MTVFPHPLHRTAHTSKLKLPKLTLQTHTMALIWG